MDPKRWETVAVFTTGMAAHAARTKLESEGIQCFVADEHAIGANPLYSIALGGVKLQVAPEELARARDALGLPAGATAPGGATDRAPHAPCPGCGVIEIQDHGHSHRPLLERLGIRRRRCGVCGARR